MAGAERLAKSIEQLWGARRIGFVLSEILDRSGRDVKPGTLLPDEAEKAGLIDFDNIDIDIKFIASFEPFRRQIIRIVDIGHASSVNCLSHILDPVNDLGQRVGALEFAGDFQNVVFGICRDTRRFRHPFRPRLPPVFLSNLLFTCQHWRANVRYERITTAELRCGPLDGGVRPLFHQEAFRTQANHSARSSKRPPREYIAAPVPKCGP